MKGVNSAVRPSLKIFFILLLLGVPKLLFGVGIDLSKEPASESVVQAFEKGHLAEFNRELGKALALSWKPFKGGDSGTCSQKTYGSWVDLYHWVDLLESDEASVTKRWLSRHLSVSEELDADRKVFHVTIHQPGSPLVRRYDRVQHLCTEELAGNPGMLNQALASLVTQPYEPRNGPLITRLDPQFIRATLEDSTFWSSWADSYDEDDFAPRVLLNLQSIWQISPADWFEFRNLALAIALVHDQPAPNFWPHRQVSSANVPKASLKPIDIFRGFVRSFREGKLRLDPRHLGVSELTYLVDAPIDPSELEYIRSSSSRSRVSPPYAFEAISYDQGRIERDVYVWPWGNYSLSSIKIHGGICVDQAYYAAVSGKALGFPTIFFSGEGRNGGHAWVGYLKGHDHWDLNVGRHGEENVATGVALNPKNWTPVTDHEISIMTRHPDKAGSQESAVRDLSMAGIFRRQNNAFQEGEAIRSALSRSPENPLLWDSLEDWLHRTGATVMDLRRHHEAAIGQFSHIRDLKAQHQEALARLAAESGDRTTQKKLSDRIIRENLGVRNDISAVAASELISYQLKTNDPDSALKSYEDQLRKQAVVGKGDFFYRVTAPLAEEFIVKGRPDLARRVLKRAFDAIRPIRGSLVDKELRKIWLKAGGV